jgi:hypothetical protein
VKGTFSPNHIATNVVIKIPTPKNTAKCKLSVTAGKAKYKPELQCIVWKYVLLPESVLTPYEYLFEFHLFQSQEISW